MTKKQKDNTNNNINTAAQCKDCERKDQELIEMETKMKRALADYTNQQKRFEDEKAKVVTFANEVLLENIIGVLDNMEMLGKHSKDEGYSLVLKNFKQVLQNAGLQEVEVQDKEFDPHTMEAIDLVAGEKNKVVETLQKGYLLKGKLLRPARVRVGAGN